MRVMLLNTFESVGGAARATSRLHRGLLDIGIESRLLVQNRTSGDPTVIGPQSDFQRAAAIFKPRLDRLPLSLYPRREQTYWGNNWIPHSPLRDIKEFSPDLVHLHWISGGFFPLRHLRSFSMPLLWTLHDSWAFTGGCNLPGDCDRFTSGCGHCPQLHSGRENDLSRRNWDGKKNAYPERMIIVVPSRWLKTCAQRSQLLRNHRIEIIPNGINTSTFKPLNKTFARQVLNLPLQTRLIAFGAMNATSDKNKGFHYLQEALRQTAHRGLKDVMAIVFGSSRPPASPDLGIPVRYLGEIKDDYSLALLYSAVDVVLLPSMNENLPNVVLEALSCGTPCVAFNVGGVADLVEHEVNGYLASPLDSADLANGIQFVLSDSTRWHDLSNKSRNSVLVKFDISTVSRQYERLYQELIKLGSLRVN